jgi:hypothetical protein
LDPIVGTGLLSEEATDIPAEVLTKQLFIVDHQAIHDLCKNLNPTKQFRKKNQWFLDDVIDNPLTLLAQQLFVDHEGIQAFCEHINPLKQFEMLREITLPGLFRRIKQKKKNRTSVRQALIAASNSIQMDSTYQAKTDKTNSKTVYLSQNDEKLHIVIDTGASVSVTPSLFAKARYL